MKLPSLPIPEVSLKRLDRGSRQTIPRRVWAKPVHTNAWWDKFVGEMSSYRFQIIYALLCGRVKTIRKRYRMDGNIFENGEKKLRFQTKTDTCGQGHSLKCCFLLQEKPRIK